MVSPGPMHTAIGPSNVLRYNVLSAVKVNRAALVLRVLDSLWSEGSFPFFKYSIYLFLLSQVKLIEFILACPSSITDL